MNIEKANVNHVKQIIDISKEFIRTSSENKGESFLIRELQSDVVESQIGEFYVALENNKVAGYIWINEQYPELRKEHTRFQEKVDLDGAIYVKQVAVSSQFARRGIASQLYDYILDRFPSKNILACIAVEPMKNIPSIRFHEKKGFKVVGVLKLHDYLGFDTYIADVFELKK